MADAMRTWKMEGSTQLKTNKETTKDARKFGDRCLKVKGTRKNGVWTVFFFFVTRI